MNLVSLHKKLMKKAVSQGLKGNEEQAQSTARSIGWVMGDKIMSYLDFLNITQAEPEVVLKDKDGNVKEINGKTVKTKKKPTKKPKKKTV